MNTRLLLILVLLPALAACQLRPRAYPDEATTTRGTPITINVLANDSDPRNREIAIVDASDSTKGSTTVNADGTIRYTPNSDALGEDIFQYRIKNTRGRTASAEVLVTILEPMAPLRATPVEPSAAAATPSQDPGLSISDSTMRATPATPRSTNTPSAEALPVPSATAAIASVSVTLFTREDDKDAGETVQLTIRRGEESLAERSLGDDALPRQTDRIEEIELRPPVPAAEASKLTLEVRKINSLGAGEAWIMQVEVLGRLSDGRTVPLLPKSLPFRFGDGSSNARSWQFHAVK